jgi:hypothetical protein
MPLSAIVTRYVPIGDGAPYGTTLSFSPCAYVSKGDDCTNVVKETGSMSVRIWPRDDYDHSFDDIRHYVDRKIGGRAGRYDVKYCWVGVLVQKGMLVEFRASAPTGLEPDFTQFEVVLDAVAWVPDPGDEVTWLAVGDWTKK